MFRLFFLFSLLMFVRPSWATSSFDENLKCFVQKDVNTCLSLVSKDYSLESDWDYLSAACNDFKNAEACFGLGSWLAVKKRIPEAEKVFGQVCGDGLVKGCQSLVHLQLQGISSQTSETKIHSAVLAAQTIYATHCKDKSEECEALRKEIYETENLKNQGSCQSNRWFISSTDAPDFKSEDLPVATEKTCLFECSEAQKTFDSAGINLIRSSCLWKGAQTGDVTWRELRKIKSDCDPTAQAMGAAKVHQSCFCVAQKYPELNAKLSALGFFAAPGFDKEETIGKQRMYVCEARVYPAHPDRLKKTSCRQDLMKLKKKVGSKDPATGAPITFDHVVCQNPK